MTWQYMEGRDIFIHISLNPEVCMVANNRSKFDMTNNFIQLTQNALFRYVKDEEEEVNYEVLKPAK